MEMLGPDGPPILKIAQLKIQFVCILPIFKNNFSDFANFGELQIFWGVGGGGRRGEGAKRKSAPRAPKTLATPLRIRIQNISILVLNTCQNKLVRMVEDRI